MPSYRSQQFMRQVRQGECGGDPSAIHLLSDTDGAASCRSAASLLSVHPQGRTDLWTRGGGSLTTVVPKQKSLSPSWVTLQESRAAAGPSDFESSSEMARLEKKNLIEEAVLLTAILSPPFSFQCAGASRRTFMGSFFFGILCRPVFGRTTR